MSKFQVLSLAALLLTAWQHTDAGNIPDVGYGSGGGGHGGIGGYGVVVGGGGGGGGEGHGGIHNDYEAHPKYHFEYIVSDSKTGDQKSHKESSNGNTVTGEYTLKVQNGGSRSVKYSADKKTGFHAFTSAEYINHNDGGGSKGSAGGRGYGVGSGRYGGSYGGGTGRHGGGGGYGGSDTTSYSISSVSTSFGGKPTEIFVNAGDSDGGEYGEIFPTQHGVEEVGGYESDLYGHGSGGDNSYSSVGSGYGLH